MPSSSLSSLSISDDNWINAFNEKLKLRSFEQFSLLLCDLSNCEIEQKNILYKILFEEIDENDNQSAENWCEYVSYVMKRFPNSRLQLQRLVVKALEALTKIVASNLLIRQSRSYLTLHLYFAQLKSNNEESLKYYKEIIWKKGIGRKFSNFYTTWADMDFQVNGNNDTAIEILQKGIASKAEPTDILITNMKIFNPSYDNQIKTKSSINKIAPITRSLRSSSAKLGKCERVVKNFVDENENNDELLLNESVVTFKKQKIKENIKQKVVEEEEEIVLKKIKNINHVKEMSSDDDTGSTVTVTNSSEFSATMKLDISVMKTSLDAQEEEKVLIVPTNNKIQSSIYSNEIFDINGSDALNLSAISEDGLDLSLCDTMRIDQSMCDTIQIETSSKRVGTPQIKLNFNSVIENKPIVMDNNSDGKRSHNVISSNNDDNNNLLPTKRRVSFSGLQKENNKENNKENDNIISSGSFSSNILKVNKEKNNINEDLPTNANGLFSKVIINENEYYQLGVLGKGGSSCVYRVLSNDGKFYAYKRVDVKGDCSDAVFENYINEIELLHSLKGSPYIIELKDAQVNRNENYIAMIMEAGEVDLSKVLTQKQRNFTDSKLETTLNSTLNPFFLRMLWQEMLEAVDHIHQNRIVHGDLKPANFVFVKGHLKLIDFGIAKAFSNDTTNIYRESQIGTVNYMAPEAIAPSIEIDQSDSIKMKLGRASDIWSLGCILYQMIYGRPPFAALNTIQKLHAIPNPNHAILYPDHVEIDAVLTIKSCLIRNPHERTSIGGDNGLLTQDFLRITRETKQQTNIEANNSIHKVIVKKNESNDNQVKDIVSIMFDKFTSLQKDTMNNLSQINKDSICKEVVEIFNNDYKNPIYNNISYNKENNTKEHNNKEHVHEEKINPSQQILSTSLLKQIQKETTSVKVLTSLPFNNKSSNHSNIHGSNTNGTIRPPLKTLPTNLMNQITTQKSGLKSVTNNSIVTDNKWMKPKDLEKNDMRSILERRIGAMRKFLNVDEQDENDIQEGIDMTNDNSFF